MARVVSTSLVLTVPKWMAIQRGITVFDRMMVGTARTSDGHTVIVYSDDAEVVVDLLNRAEKGSAA